MQIESIQLTKLKPAKYNPRKDLQPDDPEYIKLKKSILEFDLVEPIVWNKKTGNVVGGHQRLKILNDLNKKKTDVVVVNLDEHREAALNLALNKISGDWDYPKLKDILSEIDTGDFDIEITGFDKFEINDLFGMGDGSLLGDGTGEGLDGENPIITLQIPAGVWFDMQDQLKSEIEAISKKYGVIVEYPKEAKKQKKQRF